MKKQRIKYVNSGTANFYDSHIELHKDLKKYPKLKRYIIKHEQEHVTGFDLWHEFDFSFQLFYLFIFVATHPSTWKDFIPIQLSKGKIIYDLNLIILYMIIISAIIFIVKFLI